MTSTDDLQLVADEELSPEARAYEAKEVQLLLGKALVQAAFRATEQRIFNEWKRADNPLAREMCWHKWTMFQTLQTELRALAERPLLHSVKE